MRVPLEISYRNVEKTDYIENMIREKSSKLERFSDHIISCRVAVERLHRHQQTGQPFRVRIELSIPPGHELVADKNSTEGNIHNTLPIVLKDAFSALERQLKKLAEQQRGKTKKHPAQEANAMVSRMFRDENYGFIKSLDGRDIYFHRNSVVNNDFDRLEVGTGVRFVEEEGDRGPQASTVQIIDKTGAF
ncbi:MAG: HPF/RaiA family ribosome-associated protein [Syntrophales bacterium]|jgi:ribosomal subunit interface protein|nr:HPF/RaiA family ribosome-associated protein [Syntrophales bacterium]MDY0043674.1 HPF/RaiA family ribosome-associated protein [Syntrophales bacterium]